MALLDLKVKLIPSNPRYTSPVIFVIPLLPPKVKLEEGEYNSIVPKSKEFFETISINDKVLEEVL